MEDVNRRREVVTEIAASHDLFPPPAELARRIKESGAIPDLMGMDRNERRQSATTSGLTSPLLMPNSPVIPSGENVSNTRIHNGIPSPEPSSDSHSDTETSQLNEKEVSADLASGKTRSRSSTKTSSHDGVEAALRFQDPGADGSARLASNSGNARSSG